MKQVSSVLFVCMGNICRSPSAEAMFRLKAREAKLEINIDSAGTIAYHQGHSPDKRSITAGVKRGLSFDGMRARQVLSSDFSDFDLILAADKQNLQDLKRICSAQYQSKLALILDFCKFESDQAVYTEVPDPYYGAGDGFELVLDLLENSCSQLVRQIQRGSI
ncbi:MULTISPECIES: low molecular weight protein-tyrosine-phosphatase [unclassified Shewanella]|uniref:low molecular weight protein-tyrosine-phosphatase n=1 Tax=unclassified Shewanella TaxID=196818 RepID=UPI001BC4C6FB|nr:MULTISPECIES: low molecular weight protein-tyrosine-phosphatase [unclassified Shewanella]GIU12708.1 protein-tyrosine-phosphatase [Shewanella sp. MBTL60-112-B1]GIU38098.1 protein-tyrosine-phosphatase [Shewanella sp. MBTL60-112-B2]